MGSSDRIFKLRDGRKSGYCEYGDLRGKPIFYFHGWPASRFSGAETDAAAKKLGIRVISPDRPGFGLSDYQEGRTLLGWADDVTELAEKLKVKKFAVIGVSGGGPYAAVCAYKIPDRITNAAIVAGLSPTKIKGVMKGLPFFSMTLWTCYRYLPFSRVIFTYGDMIIYRYFPEIGQYLSFQAKEDQNLIKTKYKTRFLESVREAFRQGIKGPVLDLKLYTNDWGFKLSEIKTKVYLWYGAIDKNVSPEMGKYYQSQIPNSELFIDPTGGHLARYNYEEKILKALIK